MGGALLVWLLLEAASAMSIRHSMTLETWSDDGTAALLRVDGDGPEGGGSLAWVVVRLGETGAKHVMHEVSNDMSPGDGSTPQGIPVARCVEAAKALEAALTGFSAVKVDRGACARKRHEVVRVTAPRDDVAPQHGVPDGVVAESWHESPGGYAVVIVRTDYDAFLHGAWRWDGAAWVGLGRL